MEMDKYTKAELLRRIDIMFDTAERRKEDGLDEETMTKILLFQVAMLRDDIQRAKESTYTKENFIVVSFDDGTGAPHLYTNL